MTHLDNLVELANAEIKEGISSLIYSITGIVRKAERNKENVNYDANEASIVFDDTNDIFLYHRKVDSSFSVLRTMGKKKQYLITAKMELVCYAKNPDAEDYIIDRLSKIKDLEITDSDNDSLKILKEETGLQNYNIAHYIFKLNYTLKYKSDNCNTCLNNC